MKQLQAVRSTGEDEKNLSGLELLRSYHPEFYDSLEAMPTDHMIPGLKDRPYQLSSLQKFKDDVLNGKPKGKLIYGTGAGKTPLAINILAQTKGRVLYVVPSHTALRRVIEDMQQLGIKRSYQVLDGQDFNNFSPQAEITFVTAQMINHDQRFANIFPYYYSFAVFDEAHDMMGRNLQKIAEHFQCCQLHMTATPENSRTHLGALVPETFDTYSSTDLINNDGYPPWVLTTYEVDNEHLEDAPIVGNNFELEGQEGKYLNMPYRFQICRDILRKYLPLGQKVLVFMPSVGSSKKFIEEVVMKDPELKPYINLITHVDGSDSQAGTKEEHFRGGHLMAVSCNSLWNQSINVPDIQHIVLADPCLSRRVLEQRIGRGARPYPGKKCLQIHDVVSAVSRVYDGKKANRKSLSVAGSSGLRRYHDRIVINGPNQGMQFDEDAQDKDLPFRDAGTISSRSIHFTERLLDLNFIQDPKYCLQIFHEFAKIFGTALFNLANYPELFFNRSEELELLYLTGNTTKISFKDAFDATEWFKNIDFIKKEALKDIDSIRAQIQSGVEATRNEPEAEEEATLESNEIPLNPFDPKRLKTTLNFFGVDNKLWELIFKKVAKAQGQKTVYIKIEELHAAFPGEEDVIAIYLGEYHATRMKKADISTQARINNIIMERKKDGIVVDIDRTRELSRRAAENQQQGRVIVLSYRQDQSPTEEGFEQYVFRNAKRKTPRHKGLVYEEKELWCHNDTAKKIFEAWHAGKDHIIFDREMIDNSYDYIFREVLAIMGIDENYNSYSDTSNNPFVYITQLPNGDWKIPIHHIRLDLSEPTQGKPMENKSISETVTRLSKLHAQISKTKRSEGEILANIIECFKKAAPKGEVTEFATNNPGALHFKFTAFYYEILAFNRDNWHEKLNNLIKTLAQIGIILDIKYGKDNNQSTLTLTLNNDHQLNDMPDAIMAIQFDPVEVLKKPLVFTKTPPIPKKERDAITKTWSLILGELVKELPSTDGDTCTVTIDKDTLDRETDKKRGVIYYPDFLEFLKTTLQKDKALTFIIGEIKYSTSKDVPVPADIDSINHIMRAVLLGFRPTQDDIVRLLQNKPQGKIIAAKNVTIKATYGNLEVSIQNGNCHIVNKVNHYQIKICGLKNLESNVHDTDTITGQPCANIIGAKINADGSITNVQQVFPIDSETKANGQTFLKEVKKAYLGESRQFPNTKKTAQQMAAARDYLRSFGFTGDILRVTEIDNRYIILSFDALSFC